MCSSDLVGSFVFSSRNLDNFSFQVIHSCLYFIKVFLHPFALALVVSIYLVSDDLKVIVDDYPCGSYCFGEVEPCYQRFILRFIVGSGEVETDHTFDGVSFGRY